MTQLNFTSFKTLCVWTYLIFIISILITQKKIRLIYIYHFYNLFYLQIIKLILILNRNYLNSLKINKLKSHAFIDDQIKSKARVIKQQINISSSNSRDHTMDHNNLDNIQKWEHIKSNHFSIQQGVSKNNKYLPRIEVDEHFQLINLSSNIANL